MLSPNTSSAAKWAASLPLGLLVVVLICLLVTLYRYQTREKMSPGPKLSIDGDLARYMGEGESRSVLSASVSFQNTGDQPLEYQLTASCNCTELKPASGVLQARETQDIKVSMRLGDQGETTAAVTIRTNEENQIARQLNLTGVAVPEFIVQPRAIDFGTVASPASSSSSLATVNIRIRPGNPHSWQQADWESALVSQLESRRLSVEKVAVDGGLDMTVRLLPSLDRGRMDDRVVVTLGRQGKQIVIPVTSHLAGEFSVAPAWLDLRSGNDREAVSFIVWRPDGNEVAGVAGITHPAGIKVVELAHVATADGRLPRRRVFTVTLDSKALSQEGQQKDNGVIRVAIRGANEEIVVQYSK